MIHAMKTLKTYVLALGLILTSLSFYSCLDDDGYSLDSVWEGIVTVKPLSSSTYFLQLDDSTTLLPVDSYVPYFGLEKEQRAIVYFTPLSDAIEGYNHAVKIIRMDSILTKSFAEDLGTKNDSVYGTDPVKMKAIWIEDGYLNFQFVTEFGGYKKHFLNVIRKDNAASVYDIEFRHNAYDDPKSSEGWGIVSFRLNDLPDTGGQTVKLKVKYNSYDGEKVYELDYNSKRPNSGKAPVIGSKSFQEMK